MCPGKYPAYGPTPLKWKGVFDAWCFTLTLISMAQCIPTLTRETPVTHSVSEGLCSVGIELLPPTGMCAARHWAGRFAAGLTPTPAPLENYTVYSNNCIINRTNNIKKNIITTRKSTCNYRYRIRERISNDRRIKSDNDNTVTYYANNRNSTTRIRTIRRLLNIYTISNRTSRSKRVINNNIRNM